jgi:hypothetical protein
LEYNFAPRIQDWMANLVIEQVLKLPRGPAKAMIGT